MRAGAGPAFRSLSSLISTVAVIHIVYGFPGMALFRLGMTAGIIRELALQIGVKP